MRCHKCKSDVVIMLHVSPDIYKCKECGEYWIEKDHVSNNNIESSGFRRKIRRVEPRSYEDS